ncbi:MAG: pilus assembly protein CpaB [Paraglaciecola sp.]|jgi:pilus assembly protein CpaB
MNKNTITFITLSAVFGVGAVFIAKNWLDNNQQEITEEQVNVVMTTMNIPAGSIIAAKDVRLAVFPKSTAPEKTINNLEDTLGKVAKSQLYVGDLVRAERLANPGDGSYLASLIGENMRAITIRVNDVVGVAGFILPGNTVDILNTFQQERTATTEVILSQIKILAVDQRAAGGENKPQLVRAVTVEVNLTQAEILMNARRDGYLQLALRNPIDNKEVLMASEPLSEAVLPVEPIVNINTESAIETVPNASTRQRVELIRGIRQQTVQVDI